MVKITTDDGIVGWGEATRTASAKVIIETLEAMKPVLMNRNPWQNLEHEKSKTLMKTIHRYVLMNVFSFLNWEILLLHMDTIYYNDSQKN